MVLLLEIRIKDMFKWFFRFHDAHHGTSFVADCLPPYIPVLMMKQSH